MSKNKWFGTDGVRGTANEFPMTADFAFRLACALSSQVCTNKRKVAIAKDTRISCDMLEASLIAGFTSLGIDVMRLGIIPTPAVTTFADRLDVDMAVMITASHNPYQDNGIKLINDDGDKFSDETTAQIEELIDKNEFTFSKESLGKVSENYSVKTEYQNIALNMCNNQPIFKGWKIVADCANGCFYDILPQTLRALGAEVITLGVEPNGYNINRDCGSQHIEAMLEAVKQNNADLGIAVDGDGDRIKICDENGCLIKSEQLMAFLALDLEQSGENQGRAFASTKLSNTALERFITQQLKLEYHSTNVGERHVINALKANNGIIGGEESGHIVLLNYAKSGDAMMTALRILKGLARQNKKPSQIFPLFADDFLFYKNYTLPSRDMVKKIALHDELVTLTDKLNSQIKGQGRVVIHPSGTEPKIRVWVCGNNEQIVNDFGSQLWNKIEELTKQEQKSAA